MSNSQPSTEATVYRVTNLSNRKLKAFLRKSGACDESIAWIGKRDARTAWLECDDVDWIDWLIAKADGQFGLPTTKQWRDLRAPIYAEYEAKRAPIYAEWRAKRAPIYAEYEAKRDAIDAEWRAKRAPIYAEWRAAIKLLIVFIEETPEQIVRL